MSVTVEVIQNIIEIETNSNTIEIIQDSHEIVVSPVGQQGRTGEQGQQGEKGDKGDTGDTGAGVPVGGTERQVLAKIDGTDYNTLWRSNWYDYSMNVEYTGATLIASGTVYTCSIDGGTIYRFVNSTNNANGYPSEDSFYNNFDGTNLTNLIVTRG